VHLYTSKTDMVAAMLREMIVAGQLAPGAPLRQRDLAAQFEVSATPIREALRRLEAEGLVVGDAHRGATVAKPDQGALADNYRIRAALEPLAAQMATERIDAEALADLTEINEAIRALPEGDPAYREHNARFHFAIYQASGSPVLVSLIRMLWQSLPQRPAPARSQAESVRQHAEIIEAIRRRDGARAAALTAQHIASALGGSNGERTDAVLAANGDRSAEAPALTS
jgi:DNA-binding GntR family transcriptional regulator